MDRDEVLKAFVGKEVAIIETDGKFHFILTFTDGSAITIEYSGYVGSHFEVAVETRTKTIL